MRNDEFTRANNIGTIDLGFVICGSVTVCTGPDALSDSDIFEGLDGKLDDDIIV